MFIWLVYLRDRWRDQRRRRGEMRYRQTGGYGDDERGLDTAQRDGDAPQLAKSRAGKSRVES